jgi:hypothetical protein
VVFDYEDRTLLGEDALVRYVGGGIVKEVNRLKSIEVLFGSSGACQQV